MGLTWDDESERHVELPNNPEYWDDLEDPDVDLPEPEPRIDWWAIAYVFGFAALMAVLIWYSLQPPP